MLVQIEGRCLVLMGDSRVLIPEIASKYKADLVVVGRGGRGKFKR